MGRVPGVVHGYVFSGYYEACEGLRVLRAEAEDDDCD